MTGIASGIVEFLAKCLDEDEQRIRIGPFTDKYRDTAETLHGNGHDRDCATIGCTDGSCMCGSSPCNCGANEWALRDIAFKRRIIDEAFNHASRIDGEWGCTHEPEEIKAGQCPDERPEDQPLLRLLASLYSQRPGYKEEWAGERDH